MANCNRFYQTPHEKLVSVAYLFSVLSFRLKKFTEAEQWARKGLAQAAQVLPEEHFYVSLLQQALAEALWLKGQYKEAWKWATQSWEIRKKFLRLKRPFLSLREQIALLNDHFWEPLSIMVCLAAKRQEKSWIQQAYTAALYWKGWVFRTLLEQQRRSKVIMDKKLAEVEKKYRQAV